MLMFGFPCKPPQALALVFRDPNTAPSYWQIYGDDPEFFSPYMFFSRPEGPQAGFAEDGFQLSQSERGERGGRNHCVRGSGL